MSPHLIALTQFRVMSKIMINQIRIAHLSCVLGVPMIKLRLEFAHNKAAIILGLLVANSMLPRN